MARSVLSNTNSFYTIPNNRSSVKSGRSGRSSRSLGSVRSFFTAKSGASKASRGSGGNGASVRSFFTAKSGKSGKTNGNNRSITNTGSFKSGVSGASVGSVRSLLSRLGTAAARPFAGFRRPRSNSGLPNTSPRTAVLRRAMSVNNFSGWRDPVESWLQKKKSGNYTGKTAVTNGRKKIIQQRPFTALEIKSISDLFTAAVQQATQAKTKLNILQKQLLASKPTTATGKNLNQLALSRQDTVRLYSDLRRQQTHWMQAMNSMKRGNRGPWPLLNWPLVPLQKQMRPNMTHYRVNNPWNHLRTNHQQFINKAGKGYGTIRNRMA